ncbi:hypothetical protein [Micromonospora sp. NPDC093277]|uniref:hypothetical protein n=1 Tax=Micromonospora sp. NPDC093277 TaxID=3364291 RepID=UPI00382C60CA
MSQPPTGAEGYPPQPPGGTVYGGPYAGQPVPQQAPAGQSPAEPFPAGPQPTEPFRAAQQPTEPFRAAQQPTEPFPAAQQPAAQQPAGPFPAAQPAAQQYAAPEPAQPQPQPQPVPPFPAPPVPGQYVPGAAPVSAPGYPQPMSAPPMSAPPVSGPGFGPQPMSAPPGVVPPYGAPVAAPRRGRSTLVLAIVAGLLFVFGGVMSYLYLDTNTKLHVTEEKVSQRDGTIQANGQEIEKLKADLQAMRDKLADTEQDLTGTKNDRDEQARQKKVIAKCLDGLTTALAAGSRGDKAAFDKATKGLDKVCDEAEKYL